MRELFKRIIKDFHQREFLEFTKRELDIPIDSKKIISIIGPRRAGKTYFLYQTISQIPDITDVLYINFEDDRFTIKKEDLQEITNAYFELYPNKKTFYLFLDEIQEIQGWEQFVRRVYDTLTKNIYITGSSAKLLSKEIGTSLRGRAITYELYPLSFKEFLVHTNTSQNNISTREQANIKNKFNTYFETGGFPEITFFNEELQHKTLQSYSSVMLLRDIIERYELRNSVAIQAFFERSLRSFAKEISIKKIYDSLKSQGVAITRESIYDFIKYFEEAFVLLPLQQHSNKSLPDLKKIYLIDHGFTQLKKYYLSENNGRKLENMVFLELKRREQEIYYHKKKHECDFVIKQGINITQAIQVCYELNEETKQRELRGLIEACKEHKLKEGLILTHNQEDIITQQDITIDIKPVWKWLLE